MNVAEADQSEGERPARLGIGAEVRLRFGVCCPDRARGRIVAFSREQPDIVVLAIGADTWTLRRGHEGGVSTPGLLSEIWYVAESPPPAASPADHSLVQSSQSAAAEA